MYMNFSPAGPHNEQSFRVADEAVHAQEDLEGMVRSVISGTACSLAIAADGEDNDTSGMIAALEDGDLLAQWFGSHGNEHESESEREQREAVEDVHHALSVYQRNRDLKITLTSRRNYLGQAHVDGEYDEFESRALSLLRYIWPFSTVTLADTEQLLTVTHADPKYSEHVLDEATYTLENHIW